MRNLMLALAAASLTVPILPAPASAQGYYKVKVWRDSNGRLRCKRPNGTTGLIVGGAAGALIGREVAGRGDRDVGMILGAAAGALIGREVERGMARRRCR